MCISWALQQVMTDRFSISPTSWASRAIDSVESLRYEFSGMCCKHSCMIRLADPCAMSVLLIMQRRCVEGVFLLYFMIFSPLSEFLHLLFHFCLITASNCCWTAEGLIVSLCLRYVGSKLLCELRPSAALLASLSAASLPGIPVCPAIQRSMRE